MKPFKLHLAICLVFCFFSLSAQNIAEVYNGYVFPEFETGYAIMKGNVRYNAKFNYETISEKMQFLDTDDSLMEVVTDDIIAIVVGERRFYPDKKGFFYEGISIGDEMFYLQRKSKELSKGKGSGYGGYSETSSITNVGSISHSVTGGAVRFNSNELIEVKQDLFFYIKNKDKYERFTSVKALAKLFKSHQAKIEEYAKTNNTNFSKLDDVIKIMEYCYSLK